MKLFYNLLLLSVTLFSFTFLDGIDLFSNSKSAHFNWGLSARQGKRRTMEDAHCHEIQFGGDKNQAFFAVYDGHSGDWVALKAAEQLHQDFLQLQKKFPDQSIQILLNDVFKQFDHAICSQNSDAGSTAAVAYINNNTLYVAWAGDSRIVVIRDGKILFATTDHKPTNPKESERILAINKYAIFDGRVGGRLAVSRALGDWEIKNEWNYQYFDHSILTAKPEIETIALKPNDIIIIACDGLWDVLENEDAGQLITHALANPHTLPKDQKKLHYEMVHEDGNDRNFTQIAQLLRDTAYNKGSTDNISVMVIQVAQEK